MFHIFRSHVTFVHVLRMSCELSNSLDINASWGNFHLVSPVFSTAKQKWEIFKSIFPFARSFQTPKQAKNFEGSILIHWLVTDLISMKNSPYADFTAGCFLCQESLDLCESWARWKCHLDLVHMLRPPPLDGEAKYWRLWGRIYHSHLPKSSKSTTRVEGGTDLVVVVLFERSLKNSKRICECNLPFKMERERIYEYERFTDLTSSAQAMYDATQGLLRFTVDSRRCREILRQWAATYSKGFWASGVDWNRWHASIA